MCLNVVSIKDINNYNLLCVPLSKMFAAKKFHQDTVALKKKKKKTFSWYSATWQKPCGSVKYLTGILLNRYLNWPSCLIKTSFDRFDNMTTSVVSSCECKTCSMWWSGLGINAVKMQRWLSYPLSSIHNWYWSDIWY